MPIYKKPDGKYIVRVNLKISTGVYKRLNKTVDSNAAAKKIEKQFLAIKEKPDTIDFDCLLDNFLEDYSLRHKPTTANTLKDFANKHIRQYFAKYRVCDIKQNMIRDWQGGLLQAGITRETIRNIESIFKRIMDFAVSFYGLSANPFLKMERVGKLVRKEMSFWTVDDFKKAIVTLKREKQLAKPGFVMILYLSFFCGTRIGENLALTRSDVDTENRVISINKTFAVIKGQEYNLTPKTRFSVRNIAIPTFLSDMLLNYINQIPPEQVRLFAGFSESSVARYLRGLAQKAGVKRIRVHDLRHSAISYWIHLGIPIHDISRRCGHASPKITYRVYAHLYPSDDHITDILEKAGTNSLHT